MPEYRRAIASVAGDIQADLLALRVRRLLG